MPPASTVYDPPFRRRGEAPGGGVHKFPVLIERGPPISARVIPGGEGVGSPPLPLPLGGRAKARAGGGRAGRGQGEAIEFYFMKEYERRGRKRRNTREYASFDSSIFQFFKYSSIQLFIFSIFHFF